MKTTERSRELFLITTANMLVDKIHKCVEKYKDEYNKPVAGMNMFFTLRRNVRSDLVCYREDIEVHQEVRRMYKIDREFYALDVLYERIKNAESMSFMQILKLADPLFGYSKEHRERCDKELAKLIREVLNKNE